MSRERNIGKWATRQWSALACAIFLFTINALMCKALFHLEFTNQTGSIESAFISFSRWMMDHWHDRSWIPMWINGIPARQVYGPMLHTSVAQFALWTGWTPQHAYHFLTAITYCLGPVTLFWLIYRSTGRRGAALLAGLLYSLISPSTFLFGAIRADAAGYFAARRFQALTVYGEGPHVTGLMMIPLVLWMVDQAASARRWLFVLLTPIALAILVLTNWTATSGFAMALLAYVLSKGGAYKYGEPRLHWPAFIGLGIIAYMLASPWIPPSLIQTMQFASSRLSQQLPIAEKLLVATPFVLALFALHWALIRYRIDPWTRFFAYFSLITGAIVFCDMVLQRPLIPIGHRFHLEWEMALIGLIALVAANSGARLPRRTQHVLIGLLLLIGFWQGRNYRYYMRVRSVPLDFTKTEEYKMATWIGSHLQGQRIFAPGTLSEWMNLFTDSAQVFGCCDQSVKADELRIATYAIYRATGPRAAEVSTVWLKLYGASAVAVQSTVTSQLGQPYNDPKKFDGHLTELWRDGGSAIYRVPSSGSLAHVVSLNALPSRHPINGLDIEPLLPLVAAIDQPSATAQLKWITQHEYEISADTSPGDAIFVQETYDAGWHAYDGATELTTSPNILNLTTIHPAAVGHHTIHMVYSGDLEDRVVNVAQILGALLLLAWVFRESREHSRA